MCMYMQTHKTSVGISHMLCPLNLVRLQGSVQM